MCGYLDTFLTSVKTSWLWFYSSVCSHWLLLRASRVYKPERANDVCTSKFLVQVLRSYITQKLNIIPLYIFWIIFHLQHIDFRWFNMIWKPNISQNIILSSIRVIVPINLILDNYIFQLISSHTFKTTHEATNTVSHWRNSWYNIILDRSLSTVN